MLGVGNKKIRMNIWKHSLLSQRKFGGVPNDYVTIHSFIDSSKFFYFNNKHRLLLHNLYGIELCVDLFGSIILNSENKVIPVRDIAAEHCKEDLSGKVPTLNDWLKFYPSELEIEIPEISDDDLRGFIMKPFLRSGLNSSLIITCSNFGIYLVEKFFSSDIAFQFATQLKNHKPIDEHLKKFNFTEKWQCMPDKKELLWLNKLDN